MSIDAQKLKLIILTERMKEKRLKIYNIKTKKIYFDKPIISEKLTYLLGSRLYTYINGHLYKNNNCVKIRHDLIDSEQNDSYKENEIFDFYHDLFDSFDLDNHRVKVGTPLNS